MLKNAYNTNDFYIKTYLQSWMIKKIMYAENDEN